MLTFSSKVLIYRYIIDLKFTVINKILCKCQKGFKTNLTGGQLQNVPVKTIRNINNTKIQGNPREKKKESPEETKSSV